MARLKYGMRRWVMVAAVLAVVVVIVLGVSAFSIYEASQRVPEFYHQAVSRPEAEQASARDEFVAQATALASDIHRVGRWQCLFTADQINAWLALELKRHYPDMMQGDLREPRVIIQDGQLTLACRYESGEMGAVLSLAFDAYLQEPNVLALRLRRARAGLLPVPMTQVLDSMSHAAHQLKLHIEWRQSHGDPVALVRLAQPGDSQAGFRLESLELRDGELYLAGDTGPLPHPQTVESEKADQPVVGSAAKATLQK